MLALLLSTALAADPIPAGTLPGASTLEAGQASIGVRAMGAPAVWGPSLGATVLTGRIAPADRLAISASLGVAGFHDDGRGVFGVGAPDSGLAGAGSLAVRYNVVQNDDVRVGLSLGTAALVDKGGAVFAPFFAPALDVGHTVRVDLSVPVTYPVGPHAIGRPGAGELAAYSFLMSELGVTWDIDDRNRVRFGKGMGGVGAQYGHTFPSGLQIEAGVETYLLYTTGTVAVRQTF